MEFVFTVVLLIIAYQISVNTNNRRQIKTLRKQVSDLKDQVLEANQQYEMILLYGKARKNTEEETFEEEERIENQRERSGQAPDKALDE